MIADESASRICIVGAGAGGLGAAKNLAQLGYECDLYDRDRDVGGIWHYENPISSVYRSTHLISSKRRTEFLDFPMPAEYPDYPSHRQVHAYLRAYAERFHLRGRIHFGIGVERIERAGDAWLVSLSDGSTRRYRAVVLANGHNSDPKWPSFPGSFDGPTLHAAQYKSPDVLRDRRVLVVGAGNSGCDIAVESAQNAAHTFHSMRRGYRFAPKYLFGRPADVLAETFLKWRLPLWLRRKSFDMMVKMVLGAPQDYGLLKPDHQWFETHPIVNSQMLYYVGHGEITVKPDVAALDGRTVKFVDGSSESIDVIVYCTGYHISFPFIDREHLAWKDDRPNLFLNVFHPEYDNLFVVGLIQPDSGMFWLIDYQTQAIARYLRAADHDSPAATRFRQEKRRGMETSGGIRYVNSSRHLLEVEHSSYARRLRKAIAQLA